MISQLAPYGTVIVFWAGILAGIAGMLGVTGAFLQSRHNRALNTEIRAKTNEVIDIQNGLAAYTKGLGSYFYLDVLPTPGTNYALMIIKKVGTNPVYEATINFVDSQARRKPQLVDVGTLGGDNVTSAYPLYLEYGDSRTLTLFLTSRHLVHRQDIRVRRVGDQMFAATRVVESLDDTKVLYEKIDDGFPRDQHGRIDWEN